VPFVWISRGTLNSGYRVSGCMNSPWIHGVKAVRLVVYIELLFLALISDCLESPLLPRLWTGLMCMYMMKTVQIQVLYGGDIICHSGFLTMMVQSRYWRWVQVVEIATSLNHPNVFPIKFCFPNLALPDSIPFFGQYQVEQQILVSSLSLLCYGKLQLGLMFLD